MADDHAKASEQDDAPLHVLRLDVGGMHCINCPALVEQRLAELPHVRGVSVDYASGHATVTHVGGLDIAHLQNAIAGDGYTLEISDGARPFASQRGTNTPRDYLEIAAAFAILAGVVLALQHFALLPRGISVSDTVSLGLAFGIGLVASVSSCIAVTGGLLVAVAARYNAANTHLTSLERLQPHLYFNAGRLIAYALLGGAVGALGSALMLSPAATGVLTLLASAVMIVLGLQMLGLFSSLGRLMPTIPKSLARRIHGLAERDTKQTAFLLGGLTFFLPCGFTQALQLYVLATGDFLTGALTMLAFALGTLPALLSLSAVSSFANGVAQRRFLKFAGAAVILLGVTNIQSGLVLTGIGSEPTSVADRAQALAEAQQAAAMEPQRISMKVVGLDYQPNQFTVKQGVPVQWWIDASQADGCGRILVAPRLRIQKMLSASSTTLITFIPEQPGEYAFNCGMGMMTPDSKITVLPRDKG
jgi:sulfite exporter TauE/SafE/copper chaperone CopZ